MINIPIPAILMIRNDAISEMEEALRKYGFKKALFIFDDFTFDSFKNRVALSLKAIKADFFTLPSDLDVQNLIKLAFSLDHYDVVLAVGGGLTIDCGKYIAHTRDWPFISIPTSSSNDGFASRNCSLMVEGKKTTIPASVPFGIIADIDILLSAPERFILAGIGDLVSNITALYDWEFEEQMGKGTVNAFAYMLSKKAVNSFIRTPMDQLKNPILIKELVSSLTLGGISTVISGNSAPISGSEHLISHALDKLSDPPQMHGIQVGLATYLMAKVQNHRVERIFKIFTRTGFFDYVKTLPIKREELIEAINLSPRIKPGRHTYLHEKANRDKAMEILLEDIFLQNLLC